MLNSLKSDYPTYEKLLFFKSPGKRQSRSMCRDCRAKTEIIPRKEKSARRLVKEWRGPCGPNAKKDIEESKSLTRYECSEKSKYKPKKVAMGPPSQELHCL